MAENYHVLAVNVHHTEWFETQGTYRKMAVKYNILFFLGAVDLTLLCCVTVSGILNELFVD